MSSVAEAPVVVEPRPVTRRRRPSGPTKRDLSNQLASAHAVVANLQKRVAQLEAELRSVLSKLADAVSRAERAEAKLLEKPATATPPPGGPCVEALQPEAEGVIRLWIMTHDEGYRLKLIHLGPDGAGWEMVKWSDGTRYHLFQDDGDTIRCDCPGQTAHGPRCCNGQGCKHARFLRALRRLMVSPS